MNAKSNTSNGNESNGLIETIEAIVDDARKRHGLTKTFLTAIATEEGYYVDGSRPHRNNNPGDLIWGSEAERFGATHGDPRFAVFPNPQTGWEALKRWFSIPAHYEDGKLVAGYLGAKIKDAVFRFAPPEENNSDSYLANVLTWTGLSGEDVLTTEILDGQNQTEG